MSIARAVLVGTLDQEPEKRFTPQNVAVTTLWITVPGKAMANGQMAPATRVKLTCWRGMAETAGDLHKDQVIMVEGKLMLPSYQDQSGVQRKHFEVEVSALSVVPGGLPTPLMAAAGQTSTASVAPVHNTAPAQSATPAYAPAQPGGFGGSGNLSDDMYTVEDIPF
jgi:single-strand DNA-binding protein